MPSGASTGGTASASGAAGRARRRTEGRRPEIVGAPRRTLLAQGLEGVLPEDERTSEPELLEVVADHPAGGPVGLDEDAAPRAAGESLEAHRARAREEVEHGGVVDRADQVVGCLANAVARRPGRVAFRGGNPWPPLPEMMRMRTRVCSLK